MSADAIWADWPAPAGVLAGSTLRGARFSDLRLRGRPCWLNQVHGATVVDAGHFDSPPDADASISRTNGAICVVRTADCLPVLLCAADGSEVAAAHGGWRGLAAGVLENTVARMRSDAGDLLAWFGPAISQSSFEVGDEVRAAFVTRDAAAVCCFEKNGRDRWQCDLYALATQRLRAAGVTGVYGGGYCTFLETQRFFSYRRDPECGRMISFIGITGP